MVNGLRKALRYGIERHPEIKEVLVNSAIRDIQQEIFQAKEDAYREKLFACLEMIETEFKGGAE
jgi:hypothetical protein